MDKRLEKIRHFKGNVMDFDSFIKDKIEQTKRENGNDKKVCESNAYLPWSDQDIMTFAYNVFSSDGIAVEVKGGAFLGTECGDLPYEVTPDKKTLQITFQTVEDAVQMESFNEYKFANNEYEFSSERNNVFVHLLK